MVEEAKIEMKQKMVVDTELDTYVDKSFVLIGKGMETVFKSVIKENKGAKAAIYLVTNENEGKSNVNNNLLYEKYKYSDDGFVTQTDENGKEINDSENGERIVYPIVMRLNFAHLSSDREYRHATEILSATIDNSLLVTIGSDLSDEFSRNIHSSLVYRRKRFKNSVASVVYTRADSVGQDYSARVTRNNIKNTTDIFKEIKPQVSLKKTFFAKRAENFESDRMLSVINNIGRNIY